MISMFEFTASHSP